MAQGHDELRHRGCGIRACSPPICGNRLRRSRETHRTHEGFCATRTLYPYARTYPRTMGKASVIWRANFNLACAASLAQSVRLVGEALGQIAVDFRLGARSGKSLWHEPFAKEQKGSSAMPHKKNTIGTEQIDGMLDLLSGSEASVLRSIQTWEARAIEQSCVERVAWPDLFHEILRMISVMHRVLGGMVIYRDHMLQEIQDSRETYASDEAKNFLALECGKRGIEFETAYRIVQLASFCAFKPTEYWAKVRETRPSFDLREADELLQESYNAPFKQSLGIKEIIKKGKLFRVEGLKATEKDVASWNVFLSEIFSGADTRARWDALFNPSYLLKGEG